MMGKKSPKGGAKEKIMKKQFATVLSVALAGAMCFGLTACGGTAGDETPTGERLPEANFDEAWAAAFDTKNFENFKAVVNQWTEGLQGDSGGAATIVRAGNLEHLSTVREGHTDSDSYYDGEMFYNKNAEGVWETEVNGPIGGPVAQFLQAYVYDYADKADDVEYSEEEGGYILSMNETDSAEFVFQNGKIAAVSVHLVLEAGPDYQTTHDYYTDCLFTYGGQTVTLPTVGESGGTHTGGSGSDADTQTGERLPEANFKEAWAAAFDTKTFENFKMTFQEKISGIADAPVTLVREGNLEHIKSTGLGNDDDYYYDGEMFYNKNAEGVWGKVPKPNGSTADDFLQAYVYAYADKADDVEYSEEEGGYVLTTSENSQAGNTITTTYVFHFKNGKLVEMKQTMKMVFDGSTSTARISYSLLYGGQKVTLPAVAAE